MSNIKEYFKPKKVNTPTGYIWICACTDCIAHSYILPSFIYDKLFSYHSAESRYYQSKFYTSEKSAYEELELALSKVREEIKIKASIINKYYNEDDKI